MVLIRKSFLWKLGLFFLLFTLSFFSATKIKEIREFPIKQVKIFGVHHVVHDEMQHVLIPLVTKNFFAIDVENIKEQLLQMPWIADVSVQRRWPDQVIIAVSEHDPIARWNNNGLLSSTGEIFNPDIKTYPEGLPQFLGPEGEQIHMLQYYRKITQSLAPLHFKLAKFELTPYDSWSMTFADGMKVNVGYKDILTRIDHFVKVYPKIVGARAADVDSVDLRYSNGLAVRWKTIS